MLKMVLFFCFCSQSAYQLLHPDSAGNLQLICQPLHSRVSSEHVVRIDPSYYSYEGCKCQEGYMPRSTYTEDGRLASFKCVVPEVGDAAAGWHLGMMIGDQIAAGQGVGSNGSFRPSQGTVFYRTCALLVPYVHDMWGWNSDCQVCAVASRLFIPYRKVWKRRV
jgi:hypothetical protein